VLRAWFFALSLSISFGAPPAGQAVDPGPVSKPAPNRVVSVTIYPNSALVTREVTVPEGVGSFELVVTPLPPQTVNSSLYSEGTNGIQVLTTRYRQRPIKEDTREEVRKAEAQLKQLQQTAQKLQSDWGIINQNLQMLTKLEAFTGATLKTLTDKGQLNGDATITLAKYIMDSRTERSEALVNIQVQQQANQEQIQFVQRQLQELARGTNKTERDAVIVVDKKDAAPGTVRLNYLVNAASWRPQYKFRADGKKNTVQLEYLAAIVQQSGEDWSNANLILSTAQPMLNAAPPDLRMLEVAVVRRTDANVAANPGFGPVAIPMPANPGAAKGVPVPQIAQGQGGAQPNQNPDELRKRTQELLISNQLSAQKDFQANNEKNAIENLNSAAAAVQFFDLAENQDVGKANINTASPEGPSVTYHLASRLTIPSRNDEQVIEVAKIDMVPDYFYKAVPILTAHVYRLANLTNKSNYVLLPGEATMYLGTDFVGRANLPLVAIGEQFTAGFGVEPQLQVQRQLVDKSRTMQGDNQVLKYEYRILVSSYKTEPVKIQLWDRLPHADTDVVGVNLVKTAPEISTDPLYLRENRPSNLLRWDLKVDPAMTGERALAVNYQFKLELGRQMQISNFTAK
jgi:hypothetical protein